MVIIEGYRVFVSGMEDTWVVSTPPILVVTPFQGALHGSGPMVFFVVAGEIIEPAYRGSWPLIVQRLQPGSIFRIASFKEFDVDDHAAVVDLCNINLE